VLSGRRARGIRARLQSDREGTGPSIDRRAKSVVGDQRGVARRGIVAVGLWLIFGVADFFAAIVQRLDGQQSVQVGLGRMFRLMVVIAREGGE
jgi:hypothetical protein